MALEMVIIVFHFNYLIILSLSTSTNDTNIFNQFTINNDSLIVSFHTNINFYNMYVKREVNDKKGS